MCIDSKKEVLQDCYMAGDGETENRVLPGTIWLLLGIALTAAILLTGAFGGSSASDQCTVFCSPVPNWIPLAIVLIPVIAVVSLVGLIRAKRHLSNIEQASDWDAAVVFFLWLQVTWSGLITLAGLMMFLNANS
jgi:hypothetical protein